MRYAPSLSILIWVVIALSVLALSGCTGLLRESLRRESLRRESLPSACQTQCSKVSRVCTLPKRRLTENDIATHANCVRTQADRCRVKHAACVEAL